MLTLGALFGTLIGADFADRFGRQLTLVLTGAVANAGWICMALSHDFILIAAGRFIVGMSIGLVNTASPVKVPH